MYAAGNAQPSLFLVRWVLCLDQSETAGVEMLMQRMQQESTCIPALGEIDLEARLVQTEGLDCLSGVCRKKDIRHCSW